MYVANCIQFIHFFQMTCSLDSGLCVVLIILTALLMAVAVLLFYDFENVCENAKNNITNMVSTYLNYISSIVCSYDAYNQPKLLIFYLILGCVSQGFIYWS